MAGEGFMMNAIQSLKFNRAQKRSQRNGKSNWSSSESNSEKIGHDPIKATPELLEEIRTRLQAENKKRKNRTIIFAILSLLITFYIFYWFFTN